MIIMSRNRIKEEAIELIKKLPENSTWEDIMFHLNVKQQIEKGLEDIKQGRVYSHDEIKEISGQWILIL